MKKVLSVLLVLCMVFCLFPVQALATDGHAITVIVEGDGSASAPQTAKAGDDVYIAYTNGQFTELKEIIGVGPDGEFRIYPNDWYSPEFTMPDGPVTVTVKFGTIGDGDDDGGYGGEDSGIYSIMVLSAGGGTPIPDKYTATAGETVTVTPNPNAGNVFKNIQIDYYRTDGHNEIYYLSDGVTSFVMPNDIEPGGMVKVTVYYERDPNAGPVTTPQGIETYAYGPGTISAPETAVPGSTVTVSIVPNEGNKVTDLYAMNKGTGAELKMTRVGKTEYTFTMPENWAYVIVRFGAGEDDYVPGGGDDEGGSDPSETVLYNVTVNAIGNGTASVDKTKAKKGETVTVTATPDAGYEVENIGVTDANNNNVVFSNGAFKMPESDATVTVTFAKEVEKVRVNFDANGGSCDSTFVQLNMGAKIELLPTATREGYIMTGWYTSGGTKITTDTVFNESATVYAHWVSAAHTTNPGGNAFYGDLAMRDEEVLNLLLTPEDLASGEDVVVYMEVKDITGGSIPGKSAIDAKAGDDKIAAYLDITLYKKIGVNAPSRISNTGGKVTISLQLTDAVIPAHAGSDTFYIIYYHDDAVKVTSASFNPASKTLTFAANEFSTYALAYNPNRTHKVSFDANGGSGTMEAQQVNPGSFTLPSNGFTAPSGKEFSCWKVGGANKNPGDEITVTSNVTVTAVWKNKTSSGTLDNVPKTGDNSALFGWMLLSLCSAATLAAVAVYDKKRAR